MQVNKIWYVGSICIEEGCHSNEDLLPPVYGRFFIVGFEHNGDASSEKKMHAF